MPVILLTQSEIDAGLPVPANKARIEYCDRTLRGLLLEIRATSPDQGTWYLRYKNAAGKTCYKRLGNLQTMSLAKARKAAMQLKSAVQQGADPSAEAKAANAVPTLREFLQTQYLPWSQKTKKSFASDESICRVRVIPELGDMRMDKITRKQLVDFQLKLQDEGLAPATCNHMVKLVRSSFYRAIEWEVVAKNPAAGLKLLHEDNMVNNYLNEEELARLLHVLKTDANRTVCNICLFLLATGARKSEALNARWEHIDVDNRAWRIPASNAKSKKVRSLALNDTALEVINSLRGQERGGWLFLSSRGERMSCIKKVWERLREKAGLPHLRLHDLRHQAASMLVNSGRSLYEVQTQLGHASPVITQRYAHLSTVRMQEAANSIDDVLKRAAENHPNSNP